MGDNKRFCISILTIISFLCLSIYTGGCRKSSPLSPEEIDHMMSEDFCNAVIEDSNMASDVRLRAHEILDKRHNKVLDSEPILVSASLGARNDGLLFIALAFSDEDGDIANVTIREEYNDPNGNKSVLVESYPVWGKKKLKAATYYFTWVHIRKNGERKDEIAWKEYLDSGDWDKDWPAKYRPPIWISLPEEGKVRVQVCVHDYAGNVSNYVDVENYIETVESEE